MGCHRYEGRGGIGMPMGEAYLWEPMVKMTKDKLNGSATVSLLLY